jgi:hypothetical protein
MSTLLFFSRPRQLHGVHICARVLSHQAARLSFPSTAAVNPTVNFMSTPFPVLRPRSLHRLCAHARLFSCPTGVLRQTTAVGTTDDSNSEDFFRYTSGRWLWDEAARLEERYKQFNIAELTQAAVDHWRAIMLADDQARRRRLQQSLQTCHGQQFYCDSQNTQS